MPIIAQSGPITFDITGETATETVETEEQVEIVASSLFAIKHQNFVNQVKGFNRCINTSDIVGFTDTELADHFAVAIQDGFLLEDGDSRRYCTMQVANDLREQLKGYVWKSSY